MPVGSKSASRTKRLTQAFVAALTKASHSAIQLSRTPVYEQGPMPKKPTARSRVELEAAWEDLQGRIFQCFALLVWLVDIKPRLQEPVPRRRKLVANATVESTLLAVRDLDDFFSADNGRDEDIRATHYGYASPGRFLTKDVRDGINQKLVHLTYRAVKERLNTPDGPNPRQWDSADLVERAMDRVLPFFDFLEREFFVGNVGRIDDIQAARFGVSEYLHALKTVAELERIIFAANDD